jgi:epsilon-lactone hydrolase
MSRAVVLPPERTGHAAPSDLAECRQQMARGLAANIWKTGMAAEPITLGGREALRFSPQGQPRGVVLVLHGGGFSLGAPEINGAFCEALVRQCGVEAFALRYKLAPDHPFPAGVSDTWAALTALRQSRPGVPLIVCGDSAGGGLAGAVAVLSGEDAVSAMDALVLLSPWLDLTVSAATFDANADTDPFFSKSRAQSASQLYLQGEDPLHPLASPLHADVAGFPPTLIVVGSGEVLLEDSLGMAAKLRESGVPVTLEVIDGIDHVAVRRGLTLPGAAECLAHVTAFVDGALVAEADAEDAP